MAKDEGAAEPTHPAHLEANVEQSVVGAYAVGSQGTTTGTVNIEIKQIVAERLNIAGTSGAPEAGQPSASPERGAGSPGPPDIVPPSPGSLHLEHSHTGRIVSGVAVLFFGLIWAVVAIWQSNPWAVVVLILGLVLIAALVDIVSKWQPAARILRGRRYMKGEWVAVGAAFAVAAGGVVVTIVVPRPYLRAAGSAAPRTSATSVAAVARSSNETAAQNSEELHGASAVSERNGAERLLCEYTVTTSNHCPVYQMKDEVPLCARVDQHAAMLIIKFMNMPKDSALDPYALKQSQGGDECRPDDPVVMYKMNRRSSMDQLNVDLAYVDWKGKDEIIFCLAALKAPIGSGGPPGSEWVIDANTIGVRRHCK